MSQTMMVTITPHTRVEEDRSILQRARLPTLLLFLQASFVVLFGVFCRYAEVARPSRVIYKPGSHENTSMPIINGSMINESTPSPMTTTMTPSMYPGAYKYENPVMAAQHQAQYPSHIPDNYAIYQDIQVMMFVGFGFLSTYLYRYGLSSVSYNFLLGAMCIQWATLTDGWIRGPRVTHPVYYQGSDTGTTVELRSHKGQNEYYIYVDIKTMVDADYAICSTLVSLGAVLGKISLFQIAVMGIFQIAIYQANCLMIYDLLHANDPGHSMTVHVFGAYFGLVVAAILNHKETEEEDRRKGGSVYHSDIIAMIGTLFLWTLYPSFNAAYAVEEGRIRAIINTYYALTASVMTAFAVSAMCNKDKFSMIQVQNATIAGGIAVGTIAEMIIEPWGALLVGFCAGIVSALGLQYFTPCLNKRTGLHDTRGINNVHGIPGLISAFGSILAAGVATKYKYGDGLRKIFWDNRTLGQQAGYQAAALAVTIGTALLGGILTGTVLKLPCCDQPRYDDILDDEPRWVSVVDLPGNELKSRDDFALTSKQRGVAVTEFTAAKDQ